MWKFLKTRINSKEIGVTLVFIAVISLNLYFGLPRVEKFTAVDETRWSYDRVPKFWKSIKKGNWKSTSLCDKPGITLVAISGIGLPFVPDPQKYEKTISQPKTPEQMEIINKIYFSLRLPVYLFSLLSLPFFYFFIRRLWNKKIALLSVIFIGLSPILLGISLIVNTDAILWILMPFAFLSFLIYQKENNKKILWLSGFILGLSLLDKYVANLLFPFFLALVFIKYIFNDYSKEEESEYFKKALLDYLILVFVSIITVILFYPAIWVKPKELLNITLYSLAFKKVWPEFLGILALILADTFLLKSFLARKICNLLKIIRGTLVKILTFAVLFLISYVLINTFQDMKYMNFESLFFMPKPDLKFFTEFKMNLLSAFFPLIFGLTPVVSLSFILSVIILAVTRKIQEKAHLIGAFTLMLFILTFYLANSVAQISSTVRYQIVVYPIASIIAGIGLYELINLKIIKKYFSKTRFYILIAIIIFVSFLSLKSIRPFFFSYASNWLPEKYILNPRDMGNGAWEASEYLNNLPSAKKLVIWTDKKQVCEKFVGKCEKLINNDNTHDYFITSAGGKTETLAKAKEKTTGKYKIGATYVDPEKLYSENDFYDFKVSVGGRSRNFVKVINASLAAQ